MCLYKQFVYLCVVYIYFCFIKYMFSLMAKLIEKIPAALHQFIIHLFVLWWQMLFDVKSNSFFKKPCEWMMVQSFCISLLCRGLLCKCHLLCLAPPWVGLLQCSSLGAAGRTQTIEHPSNIQVFELSEKFWAFFERKPCHVQEHRRKKIRYFL